MTDGDTTVSAAVLAGGESSRMGRPKALLTLGDETMLAHQVRKLLNLRIPEIMISGGYAMPGCISVPDVYPAKGPLGGIHACLQRAKGDGVLFIGIDTPLVPEDALMVLVDEFKKSRGAVILTHDGKTEPLMGVYPVSAAVTAEEILKTEKTSVRRFLDEIGYRGAEYSGDMSLIKNVNTPEEYEELLRSV